MRSCVRALLPLAALSSLVAAPAAATVKAGVEKYVAGDYKGAMLAWLPYAARGDADAQFNLGQLYKLGRGVTRNTATATDYYRKAAQKGHVPAQSNLGVLLYQSGNKPEAVRWWTLAAAKGDGRAQYMLGVLHFNGDTVPKNWPLAYAYILRAQAAGVPQVPGALATMNGNISLSDRQRGEQIAATLAAGGTPATALVDARPLPRRIANPAPKGGRPATAPTADTPSLASMVEAATAAPAVAAPAPVETPAPVATSATATSWRVQLGAYSQKAMATEAWSQIRGELGPLVAAATPIYAEASNMVRLQLGPYPRRDEARQLCAKLAAAGRSCFVVAG